MALCAMNMISKILVLTIFIFPFLTTQANAQITTKASTYVQHFCLNQTITDFIDDNHRTTNSLLSDLTLHSSNYTFYNSSASSGPTTSYGLFYCTRLGHPQNCHNCVQTAASKIQSLCPFDKAALIFYTQCTLRYANWTVYASPDDSFVSWYYSDVYVSYNQLYETLQSALETVINKVVSDTNTSNGFSIGKASLLGTRDKVYVHAECTPDILGSACQNCLQIARLKMREGCCKDEVLLGPQRLFIMTFMSSCQLRYVVSNASVDIESPSSNNGSSSSNNGSPSLNGMNFWYIMLALVVATFGLH